ncbi:AI-2E family transporter [Bombilactobacillus thymidiniphilus]|uniref:AI-2E family transporter n=1 Tax=Bombilactobacillus thymidiniphilus TaxID=2923363 RepID=A0ABY4PBZ0_9LACO|nr:AI-2E family transporter [Bombilactobacillus thymidiniphilus]UQS83283.1 AI-2E family transporter [Bombilactobacillus thymidiniphilus]
MKTKETWFTKWFLNNKITIFLLNILLIFLIIAIFAQIGYVFRPINKIISIVLPPIVVAGILYYLINPLINFLEKRCHINRILSITVIFLLIILLLVGLVLTLIPAIQSQVNSLIHNLPHYWNDIQQASNNLLDNPHLRRFHLDENISWDKFTKSFINSFDGTFNTAWNNFTSAVGVISNILMIILTAPFILFFLLKDDRKIKPLILKYVPLRLRNSTSQTLSEINESLSSYVRGQLTVAFWVAVMFSLGYLIAGMPYGVLLGIFAGLCNLIPYVGSAIGLMPAIILALLSGHNMIFSVIIIFAVEQTIETRVVSPLVVGNKMKMHPVTTILVLLVSGGMFGLIGVIGGIPIFAILKILVSHFFDWVVRNSTWYQNNNVPQDKDM